MPAGKIYCFCPECSNRPFGGIKKIYNLVDILNELGYSSYLVHTKPGFRCDWFENNTPIAYLSNIHEPLVLLESPDGSTELPPLSQQDILVVPETMAYRVIPQLVRPALYSVIFNQNPYLMFRYIHLPKEPFSGERERPDLTPYYNDNLLGVITISSDEIKYMHFVFPQVALYPIHISIDFSLFNYSPNKKKQIAFMPRKCPEDCIQLIMMLKERNALKEWTFVPIDEMSEEQVSQVLKDSALFLSFSYEEGFGLPPVEAMASGCIVIGYHGQAGKEFFKEPFAFSFEHSDLVGFAAKVEQVALDFDQNPAKYIEWGRQASEFVATEYSKEREKKELGLCWKQITQKHQKLLKGKTNIRNFFTTENTESTE